MDGGAMPFACTNHHLELMISFFKEKKNPLLFVPSRNRKAFVT